MSTFETLKSYMDPFIQNPSDPRQMKIAWLKKPGSVAVEMATIATNKGRSRILPFPTVEETWRPKEQLDSRCRSRKREP